MIIHRQTKAIECQSHRLPGENWMGADWIAVPEALEAEVAASAPYCDLQIGTDGEGNEVLLGVIPKARPVPVPTAEEVRERRDQLLAETDWTQIGDNPLDEASQEAMRIYRQALRDVPEQSGFPGEVVWPDRPKTMKEVR